MTKTITLEVTAGEMEAAQRLHLTTLETWAAGQPKVRGVSPLQALIYDLIQVSNARFLDWMAANE